MEEHDDNITQPIIPSAGYINKPKSKKKGPNKKTISIMAIAAATIAVVSVITAIVIINHHAPSVTEEESSTTTRLDPPEDISDTHKAPDVIHQSGIQKTLAVKTNYILTHGYLNSSRRSVDAPTFYTDGSASYYFNHLTSENKMSIILGHHQNSNQNPELTDNEVSKFSSKTCQMLFKEDNCKLIKSEIKASSFKKITQSSTTLEQEYTMLFGKVGALSNQLMDTCPYFSFVPELNVYVYRHRCGRLDYVMKYFYQYDYRSDGKLYYVYFAGGSTAIDQSTGKRSLLFKDIDASEILDNTNSELNIEINSENYQKFQHYRMVFKKDGNNNYIYQKLELVEK